MAVLRMGLGAMSIPLPLLQHYSKREREESALCSVEKVESAKQKKVNLDRHINVFIFLEECSHTASIA